MTPFVRHRDHAVGVFDPGEARLVANLAAQLIELLRDRHAAAESSSDPLAEMVGMSGPAAAPEDPVLARLLPDAYHDNPEDSAEFRRYTEQSLTSAKVANAEAMIDSLREGGMGEDDDQQVEVQLDSGSMLAWLRTLTDLRIALAVRLGLDDDEERQSDDSGDESTAAMTDVYDWLGFVQETLVQAAE